MLVDPLRPYSCKSLADLLYNESFSMMHIGALILLYLLLDVGEFTWDCNRLSHTCSQLYSVSVLQQTVTIQEGIAYNRQLSESKFPPRVPS